MRRALSVVLAIFGFGVAHATETPIYAPAPSWVKPVAIPAPARNGASALEVLLEDQQIRFSPDGDSAYEDRAIKIDGQVGLSALGNISFVWDPQIETLVIHRFRILRDGKEIDLLAGASPFTVLRRETNLEIASLDGTLTATMAPAGLQVGDVLEFSYSKIRRDPVLGGHSQQAFTVLDPNSPIDHFHVRALWNAKTPMRWSIGKSLGIPTITTAAEVRELILDDTTFTPPKPPEGAPARYGHPGLILFSDFTDWSQVSSLVAPLFDKAARLAPESPLNAEIAKIAAQSTDPKVRAATALHLVQQQVRYLFVGLNAGGYTPAAADLTWSRRYGDCKGKTALLLALLHGLGIDAQPALASIANGDGLDQALPQIQILDHVLVRAKIDGKVYWLDGTKPADRALDDIPSPVFQWALPVQPNSATLVGIEYPPPTLPLTETHTQIDMSAGPDKPAPTHMELIFRGDIGMITHLGYSALDEATLSRQLTELWTQNFPWITVGKVGMTWDEAAGVARLTMDGKSAIPWSPYGGGRQFHLPESTVGGDISLARQPGPDQNAPFATPFPFFHRLLTEVTLPSNGQGYSLEGGEDLNETIAGIAYVRRATQTKGLATLEITAKALAREFPADEAPIAQSRLHDLGQKDVWLDFFQPRPLPDAQPISPVKSLSATGESLSLPNAETPPTDTVGFRRRGLERLAARQYALALADLNQVVKRDPKDAKAYYNLGVAHAGLGDYKAAKASFDKALSLNPDDGVALRSRGRVRLATADIEGAIKDFDAYLSLNPQQADGPIQIATALENAGAVDPAILYWNRAVLGATDESRKAKALVGRCRTRAEAKSDLDAAMEDCEAALRLTPNDSAAFYGHGLVKLRRAEFMAAITDFDAALSQSSGWAMPIFGRGLAELGAHDQKDADIDFAAAMEVDPEVASKFAAWGLSPK